MLSFVTSDDNMTVEQKDISGREKKQRKDYRKYLSNKKKNKLFASLQKASGGNNDNEKRYQIIQPTFAGLNKENNFDGNQKKIFFNHFSDLLHKHQFTCNDVPIRGSIEDNEFIDDFCCFLKNYGIEFPKPNTNKHENAEVIGDTLSILSSLPSVNTKRSLDTMLGFEK